LWRFHQIGKCGLFWYPNVDFVEDIAVKDKLLDETKTYVHPEALEKRSLKLLNKRVFDYETLIFRTKNRSIVRRHGQILFHQFNQEYLRVESLYLEVHPHAHSRCSPVALLEVIFESRN